MTGIDTAGSQGSESEISATLVSLRERFEGVRRDVMQRVRGHLGNLSVDQENAIEPRPTEARSQHRGLACAQVVKPPWLIVPSAIPRSRS